MILVDMQAQLNICDYKLNISYYKNRNAKIRI